MDSSIIYKYFKDLTPKQISQIEMLYPLYLNWNSKINVISRKDIESLYLHHILHSLAIAKCTTFSKGSTIIDIGTGGGFPGIPLAIFFPEANFTLCDSINKKIRVVSEVATSLELRNITPLCTRFESLKGGYDYAVSRAVSSMQQLMPMIKGLYSKEAFFLKGGDVLQELGECGKDVGISSKQVTIHNISDYFEEEYFYEKRIIQIIA